MPNNKIYSIKSNYNLSAAGVIRYNPAAFATSQSKQARGSLAMVSLQKRTIVSCDICASRMCYQSSTGHLSCITG
jgi:hypothetical protein